MPQIFASADIAALVAAFPPPLPTKIQPSLVKSNSGNNLYNSQKVLSNFRNLLETTSANISLNDLPRRLGVRDTAWLFECYEGSIHYSANGKAVVPQPRLDEVLADLKARAEDNTVNLGRFSADEDVARDTLGNLDQRAFRYFPESGLEYVASRTFTGIGRVQIGSHMRRAGAEKVYLSRLFPALPRLVLEELARERMPDLDGSLDDAREGLVFVPSSYDAAQAESRRAAPDSVLETLVRRMEENGYCLLTSDAHELEQNIRARYNSEHPDDAQELVTLSTARAMVLKAVLDETMKKMKSDVAVLAATARDTLDDDTESAVVATSSKPELASLLLRSERRKDVEDALSAATLALAVEERKHFDEAFQTTVMAPLHLYAAGLETVHDATLKTRLDEYLAEHFRKEAIPAFINTAAERKWQATDRNRARQIEKLAQSSAQAKTLPDIQSAVTKFSRKLKIASPTRTQIEQVRTQILQHKLQAMDTMSRGSDVLQNLIWILLAQQSGALFMSSGKDTSRMIKLVADAATAEKLGQWRDGLKAGAVGEEELGDIRKMARQSCEDQEVTGTLAD